MVDIWNEKELNEFQLNRMRILINEIETEMTKPLTEEKRRSLELSKWLAGKAVAGIALGLSLTGALWGTNKSQIIGQTWAVCAQPYYGVLLRGLAYNGHNAMPDLKLKEDGWSGILTYDLPEARKVLSTIAGISPNPEFLYLYNTLSGKEERVFYGVPKFL